MNGNDDVQLRLTPAEAERLREKVAKLEAELASANRTAETLLARGHERDAFAVKRIAELEAKISELTAEMAGWNHDCEWRRHAFELEKSFEPVDKAVAAEQERCTKVVESHIERHKDQGCSLGGRAEYESVLWALEAAAEAIRRGE